MHIVHLISNFRWTERSEPATDWALGQREGGATVTLVCGRNRGRLEDSIEYQASRKGIEPLTFHMRKHFRWLSAFGDIRQLRRLLKEKPVDVIHCHMENAHLLGALAKPRGPQAPRCVATLYDPEGPDHSGRFRRICAPRTDGWIVVSERARQRLIANFGVSGDRVEIIVPPVDVERFRPAVEGGGKPLFALAEDDVVLGMVARFAAKRRVDLMLDAVKRIADRCPRLRCLLVGRGVVDEVVVQPAESLGIRDRMVVAGYCRWEKLVQAYSAMDMLVYPVPGTDASARTVREAMASGLPVIAGRVGILPDLIEEGVNGLIADLTPESFAEAILSLYEDETRRRALGQAARKTAEMNYSRRVQADKALAFYRRIMGVS